MPCVGVDGCGHALKALKIKYVARHVYDLEAGYKDALAAHLGPNVAKLGKKDGDLTQATGMHNPCQWTGGGANARR